MTLTSQQQAALLRWRLILGKSAEGALGGALSLRDLGGAGGEYETQGQSTTENGGERSVQPGETGSGIQNRQGKPVSSEMVVGIDEALSFIYEDGSKGASLDGSSPYLDKNLATWLQDIRKFFPTDSVALIQKDAIERKDLKALLFEPETLPFLEKNIDLVSALLHYKDLIPDKAKDVARQLVQEIVEEIKKRLENEVRQTIIGAVRRNRHSVVPVYPNIDWKTTIHRNLKHYNADLEMIIPERFYFWANQIKLYEWNIILAVDQSGSMGTSIIYSSILGAILASINVVKTHLIFFDTEVVDMTPHLHDPVDILFGARLGGGTDIAKAVAYAAGLVENPGKTIFIVITDLYEGGKDNVLLHQFEALVESHVKTLCLLALTDDGKVSYDHNMAKKVAAMGVHTFGCTPQKLITILEHIIKGQEIGER
jgi:hypothetical protein